MLNENTKNNKETVYNVGKVVENILKHDNADVREFMKRQAERLRELRELRTLREEGKANKAINGKDTDSDKNADIGVDTDRVTSAAAKIIADEMLKSLGRDFSIQVARGIMGGTYGMGHNYFTWDEIFNDATNKEFLSDELNAKDNARAAMRDIILDETGVDIEEAESAEDEIEKFLKESNITYYFDESGSIAREVIK